MGFAEVMTREVTLALADKLFRGGLGLIFLKYPSGIKL